MATTTDDLLIRIELEAGKARQGIDGVRKDLDRLNKTTDKNADSIDGFGKSLFKMSAVAGLAIKGLDILVSSISQGLVAFTEASDAVTKLNHALELTGSTSIKATTEQFIKLGETVEGFGVASTESVLKLSKIGIASGLAADEIEKLIKTAADLSVAREIPLETAFKSLSATLKGSSGALSSFLPELKNLTEEQLKAGKAIDYVSLQVSGFAARNLETYAGKWELLKSRVGDTGEYIAGIAIDIIRTDAAIDSSTKNIERFNDRILAVKDDLVSFGRTIVSALVDVWDFVIPKLEAVATLLNMAIGGALTLFTNLTNVIEKTLTGLSTFSDKLRTIADYFLKLGAAGMVSQQNMLYGVKEASVEATKATVDYVKKAEAAQKALDEIGKETRIAENTKKAGDSIDELIKKIQALETANATAGKTGEAAIKAKFQADIKEIDNIKKKIEGYGALNGEVQSLVNKASKMMEGQKAAEIEKYRADILKQINEKNLEIETNIKAFNATKREQIEYELDAQLKLLEIKEAQLAADDAAGKAAISRQKELLKTKAGQETSKLPSGAAESLIKGGQSIADSITGAFSSGSLQMIGAAASAVGMIVTAANAVLDMIPNMINGIAGVFEKLTDFPNILFDAFSRLFDSVINFVSDFIPNILNFIPKMLEKLDSFVLGLVDAFVGLFAQLPEIIFSIVDRLPDLVQKLATSLTAALPEIMIALTEFMITKAPEIFLRIAKAIAVDIPIAIVKGVIKGIGKIAEKIKSLFTGKGIKVPKVQIDTKQAQQVASKFAGSASRLFKVGDLTDSVKDNMEKITDDIEKAFNKGTNWIKEAWNWVMKNIIMPIYNFIRDAWLWVYDNIISPIIDGIKAIWTWVFDKIINPLINGIKAVWDWFWNNISKPFIDGMVGMWKGIYDKILKPFIDGITAVWKWFWENISKPFVEALFGVWKWIYDAIIMPFVDLLKGAFDGLVGLGEAIAKPIMDVFNGMKGFFSAMGDFFTSLFKLDFSGMQQAIKDAFGSASETMTNLFRGMINPIIDVFNGLIGAINGMKIPELGWSISTKLGSWSGVLIPEFDLIPGEIGMLQKLAKGGLADSNFGTDTVPAMLTPGEFVVNRRGVESGGLDLLTNLNRGISPGSNQPVTVNIEVNIDAKTTMDEGYIRGKLIPTMTEELKRASLDGKFVISSRGIR